MNIDDWVLALAGSRTLVGRPVRDDRKVGDAVVGQTGTKLSPVYDMSVTASQAGGNMQIHRTCFPILLYASIEEVDLPADAIVIRVTTLLENERKELSERIEAAEKMKTALRTAASRIQIARAIER